METYTVTLDRSSRLAFESKYFIYGDEWFNTDEFKRIGHIPWQGVQIRERNMLGIFRILNTVTDVHVLVPERASGGYLALSERSLEFLAALQRMNVTFDRWTSIEVSDGTGKRLAIFFRKKEDAVLAQMLWG